MHETSEHILTQCNYTEAVWNLLAATLGLHNYGNMNLNGGPKSWMFVMLKAGSKQENSNNLGALFTFDG
jgi:hypothetical protein